MKSLLVLFVAGLSIVSCSTIEDNSPAFQGLTNNSFFKAVISSAVITDDGSLVIRGENGNGEAVTILIGSQGETQVSLGASVNNPNEARYVDQGGNEFSTVFDDASGGVVITFNGSESVSGEFRFTAFTSSKTDTVTFSQGFMFEVPILTDLQ